MPASDHTICETCWRFLQPGRTPFRMAEPHRETAPCCYCGTQTRSGIYLRAVNASMPRCPGGHEATG